LARPAVSTSSPSTLVEVLCDNCGKAGVATKLVTRSFGSGADLLVIEHIPMLCCPTCGSNYFTAKTLHEIERIKTLRKSIAVEKAVAVAEFG
jgi:YgiT-type zinc finger domain-containing protein